MLATLIGSTSLPAYELDRGHVEAPRTRVRPFDPQRGFSGDPKCSPIPTTRTD